MVFLDRFVIFIIHFSRITIPSETLRLDPDLGKWADLPEVWNSLDCRENITYSGFRLPVVANLDG